MFVPCPYDSMVECNPEVLQFCENCGVYRSLHKKDNEEPKENKPKKGYPGKEITTTHLRIFGIVWIIILVVTIALQYVMYVS